MGSETTTREWELALRLLDPQSAQSSHHWRFADRSVVQIGRAEENDVLLRDPRVSRYHSTLFHDGKSWFCASIGSNGTYVDGKRIAHLNLQSETVIQLGRKGPRLLVEPNSSMTSASVTVTPQITMWIDELMSGDESAAQKLWEHYFDRIVQVARRKLGHTSKRVSDEEDVAASVFGSLFMGISEGRFPELAHRDNLWRLLIVMTSRKAIDYIHHERRQKRGGGAVRGESMWVAATGSSSTPFGLAQFMAAEPTPEFAALLSEETDRLIGLLEDESLKRIALWKMEGFTNEEIAEKMGCTTRTVERKLQTIREIWSNPCDLTESETPGE